MKYKIMVTIDKSVDSKEEIEHELRVLAEITGVKSQKAVHDGRRVAVFEGEFHEFYQRVKDRIMSKIKAYE
ncbi:hypothetical protein LCGC14_0390360 [marine sediment metagenome]|uniref:Uncharacterized protein n=1 Tax=marine sediment metagenome TaxID=412755 RepID=A0A0F9VLQ8_9ZZZZ